MTGRDRKQEGFSCGDLSVKVEEEYTVLDVKKERYRYSFGGVSQHSKSPCDILRYFICSKSPPLPTPFPFQLFVMKDRLTQITKKRKKKEILTYWGHYFGEKMLLIICFNVFSQTKKMSLYWVGCRNLRDGDIIKWEMYFVFVIWVNDPLKFLPYTRLEPPTFPFVASMLQRSLPCLMLHHFGIFSS